MPTVSNSEVRVAYMGWSHGCDIKHCVMSRRHTLLVAERVLQALHALQWISERHCENVKTNTLATVPKNKLRQSVILRTWHICWHSVRINVLREYWCAWRTACQTTLPPEAQCVCITQPSPPFPHRLVGAAWILLKSWRAVHNVCSVAALTSVVWRCG